MQVTKYLALSLCLGAALTLAACSSDSNPTSDGPTVKKDGRVTGPFPTNLLLQTVVNKLIMPTAATEYSFNYDTGQPCPAGGGPGCKNQLGTISATLAGYGLTGFNFQDNIGKMVDQGDFLLLFEIYGASLTSETNAGLQGYLGATSANPPDFTGAGTYTIKADSPKNLKLQGSTTASKMKVGPGQLVIPIPAGDNPDAYPQVSLNNARLEATVADTATGAMTGGTIYGVIPTDDVNNKMIPPIAASVNKAYTDPKTDAAVKGTLKSLFDTDQNGTIAEQEFRDSGAVKLLLKSDVEGGLSVGLGFTAVKAKITK